jgi:signal peptidase II
MESAPTSERQPSPLSNVRFRRRDAVFFLIAAGVVVLDQITKAIVRANLDVGEAWPDEDWILNITNITNSGAAFGILKGQTIFLVTTSLIGLAAIVLYYVYPPFEHGIVRVALALMLGGAIGNLIDRVRFGEVTDFVNFNFFPAFNVADSAISIGVVTMLVFLLMMQDGGKPPEPDELA